MSIYIAHCAEYLRSLKDNPKWRYDNVVTTSPANSKELYFNYVEQSVGIHPSNDSRLVCIVHDDRSARRIIIDLITGAERLDPDWVKDAFRKSIHNVMSLYGYHQFDIHTVTKIFDSSMNITCYCVVEGFTIVHKELEELKRDQFNLIACIIVPLVAHGSSIRQGGKVCSI